MLKEFPLGPSADELRAKFGGDRKDIQIAMGKLVMSNRADYCQLRHDQENSIVPVGYAPIKKLPNYGKEIGAPAYDALDR